MADSKLSELSTASTVGPADLLYLVQNGLSKKTAVSSVASSVAAIINAVTISSGTVLLQNYNAIKGEGTSNAINVAGSGFVQMQWTTDAGVASADPNYSPEPTNWAYVDSNGFHVETNINNSSSAARYWGFGLDGTTLLPWAPAAVPQYTTSAGVQGAVAFDSSAVYVCVATNTWKRALLTDW